MSFSVCIIIHLFFECNNTAFLFDSTHIDWLYSSWGWTGIVITFISEIAPRHLNDSVSSANKQTYHDNNTDLKLILLITTVISHGMPKSVIQKVY